MRVWRIEKRILIGLSWTILLCLLELSGWNLASAENINTEAYFPDSNFRRAVERFMGVEPGGAFSREEAASKTGLFHCWVVNGKIRCASGIELLTGIEKLACRANHIEVLDLSANTALTTVHCDLNQICALDLSHHPRLEEVNCSDNLIRSLRLANNGSLRFLNCARNRITELDLSSCAKLETIECERNYLTELRLADSPLLRSLNCDDNRIARLDLRANPALRVLDCSLNRLKYIGLHEDAQLAVFRCNGNWLSKDDLSPWVSAQSLPSWFFRLARGRISSERGKAPYTLAMWVNPYYLSGDFDGDGVMDLAVLVEDSDSRKNGIAFVHRGTGEIHIVGAGTGTFENPDDFYWMDAWKVFEKKTLSPAYAEGPPLALIGEAVITEEAEAGGAIIYWDGSQYRCQLGD